MKQINIFTPGPVDALRVSPPRNASPGVSAPEVDRMHRVPNRRATYRSLPGHARALRSLPARTYASANEFGNPRRDLMPSSEMAQPWPNRDWKSTIDNFLLYKNLIVEQPEPP